MFVWLLLGLAFMNSDLDKDLKQCQERLRKCSDNAIELKKKIEAFQQQIQRKPPPPPKPKKT